eukprot:6196207-Amphidinium_carterae.1
METWLVKVSLYPLLGASKTLAQDYRSENRADWPSPGHKIGGSAFRHGDDVGHPPTRWDQSDGEDALSFAGEQASPGPPALAPVANGADSLLRELERIYGAD